ncbi:hypothetical protein Tsp_11634 [Trichinella spiralis]|uniref:hypothetical protein n=1 Tax=Trichinella spiralis TaxID=6334 RepID=UPI0001EFE178|nr:hypothetical protein Tsp_11634 [Trichinella spiralis]
MHHDLEKYMHGASRCDGPYSFHACSTGTRIANFFGVLLYPTQLRVLLRHCASLLESWLLDMDLVENVLRPRQSHRTVVCTGTGRLLCRVDQLTSGVIFNGNLPQSDEPVSRCVFICKIIL